MGKSGEKLEKVGEKWEQMVKSGEKWRKVVKSVEKSGKKWRKSGEKVGKFVHKIVHIPGHYFTHFIYQKLTKHKIRSSWSYFEHCSKSLISHLGSHIWSLFASIPMKS